VPQRRAGPVIPQLAPSKLVQQGVWSGCGEGGGQPLPTRRLWGHEQAPSKQEQGRVQPWEQGHVQPREQGRAQPQGRGRVSAREQARGAAIGLIVGVGIGSSAGGTGAAGTLRSGVVGLPGSRLSRTSVLLRGAKGEPCEGFFRA
jgi:hypothetical protein